MEIKIPNEMKAVIKSADRKKIVEVANITVPKPEKGEVLIRVEASAVGFSDESFAKMPFNTESKTPIVPGLEGAGVIVSLGPEVNPSLLNQRVAFCNNPMQKWNGAWAQYMSIALDNCAPIGDLPFEDTCMLYINPLTVLGFLFDAEKRNAKGIVHTAAASSVGQMLVKLCIKRNLQLINIVRRDEQADLLKKLGAEYVLNQTAPDFMEKLSDLTKKLGINLCFDAVGGELTGKLLSAMPPGSSVVIYGALDSQPISGVNPIDFVSFGKKIEGFWLGSSPIFNPAKLPQAIKEVLDDLKTEKIFKAKITKRLKLEECSDYILNHRNHPTDGKTILLPNA